MDRLELHEKLKAILKSNNVYFQPPSGLKIQYPCIIYSPDSPVTRRANNRNYIWVNRYEVKVITKDIESETPRLLTEEFPYCSTPRHYVADNLHHFTMSIEY